MGCGLVAGKPDWAGRTASTTLLQETQLRNCPMLAHAKVKTSMTQNTAFIAVLSRAAL